MRGTFTGPVNLGNPVEFTVMELATRVIRLTDSKSKVVFKPLPTDDPRQRKPDITLAESELSWHPRVELNEGLKRTIAYFSELLELPLGRNATLATRYFLKQKAVSI
jgi:UDP-glucuronate decarboxylase